MPDLAPIDKVIGQEKEECKTCASHCCDVCEPLGQAEIIGELEDLLDRFFVLGQDFANANPDCESEEYAQYGEQYNKQRNAIIDLVKSRN